MEALKGTTNKKLMNVWIIAGVVIIVALLVWFVSSKNVNVLRKASPPETNTGKTEFNDESATEFIYSRLQQVNPATKKEAVRFIVEKEWKWQYANAPKTDSNITLVERTDKRLLDRLVEESNKAGYKLNREEVKLILNYLENYEDSLAK